MTKLAEEDSTKFHSPPATHPMKFIIGGVGKVKISNPKDFLFPVEFVAVARNPSAKIGGPQV